MSIRHAWASRAELGVAIVAVMWIVAGLTLLVAGMISASRANVSAAQLIQGDVEATALGDGAIQRAVLDTLAGAAPITRATTRVYAVGGRSVAVRIQPANGFVNVNTAPERLLRDLFVFGAGLAEVEAEALAQRTIDWRDPDDAALPAGAEEDAYIAAGTTFRPRGERLEVPEDLLQVLGFSFDTYVRIAPMITVVGEALQIDPLAAGIDVLTVLAHGDVNVAQSIAAARDAGDPVIDTTRLEQAHLTGGGAQIYRFEAVVADGSRVRTRVHWVDMGCQKGALPWCLLRIEPVRSQKQGVASDGA